MHEQASGNFCPIITSNERAEVTWLIFLYPKSKTSAQKCPTVRQGLQKRVTNQKLKALFKTGKVRKTWLIEHIEYFIQIILIHIVRTNQWTPFSNTVYWWVLVLTITIRANIVEPQGDNIHSYYWTTVTKDCRAPGFIECAPGLKYLDSPDTSRWVLSDEYPYARISITFSVFCIDLHWSN